MEFRVLGPLEVRDGRQAVTVGGRRLRTLLAALLVEAGRVVSVDTLAEAMWGDRQPADPRNAIQTSVARLREVTGGALPLATRSPGYVLEVTDEQVDARRFERLLDEARGRQGDPAGARPLLEEALGLWRGPAYAEFVDGVARTEALRLEEGRLAAREALAEARLALGEAADLVGELEADVADHPLRERFVELHVRALALVDRQADALAAYRAYRDRLAEETGLEPSPSARALEAAVLRGEFAGASPEPSTPRENGGAGTPAGRAPIPATSTALVGREREVGEVRAQLDGHRVVTLTGTGGVGKSRLAAEVAAAVDEDGVEVAWIGLAAVSDPAAVDHVVADALGVDLTGDRAPRQALLDALLGRRQLVVVDNAEHLLAAVAPLVDQVQRACPQVQVLATSRERLAIPGERVVAVPPLDITAPGGGPDVGPAARLFVERATDVAREGDLLDHRATVVEICRQLDGLPLAIELAAARTAALSVEDLLEALREDVPSVVGTRRSEDGRHRDLWAVVDWSYRLLGDDERLLFDRLGVFAGAFGVEEAHAACAPNGWSRSWTTRTLAALVEQSLVVRPSAERSTGAGRYRLLRPLRAFARQRLADRGELAALAGRHAVVFTERAEHAAGPPLSEDGRRWLEASLDDLREARRRAVLVGDGALLGRLVAAVHRFDYWRPGCELLGWADDALAMDGIDDLATAPQVHAAASAAAWMRGDLARARRLAERGAQLGRGSDDPACAIAYEALGDASTFLGRLDEAEAAFREQARLARLDGDPDGEATGLASASLVLAYGGRVEEAVAMADAADRVAAFASHPARAFVRYAQGECRADADPERAQALVDEAVELAQACDAWFVEGVARVTAVTLRARHGDPEGALPAFASLVRHWRRSGSWTQQWTTLRNLVVLLVRLEVDDPAVAIAAAAEVGRTSTPAFGAESDRLDEALATARDRLGAQYEAAYRRGEDLAANEAVDLALTTIEEATGAASRPRTTRRTM